MKVITEQESEWISGTSELDNLKAKFLEKEKKALRIYTFINTAQIHK